MMSSPIVLKLAIGYALSVVLDLLWLILYTGGWWNGSTNELVDNSIDRGVKQMVIVFSFTLFFVKIALLICLKFLADALKT